MIPKRIYPMLVLDNPHEDPFKVPGYILQEKFDGTRTLAIKKNGKWYLMTRLWKNDISANFPEVVQELQFIREPDVILDGEMTFFKNDKAEFLTVLAKPETKRGYKSKYMVFDILRYGKDVTKLPLVQRLAILSKIIPVRSKYVKLVKTINTPTKFKQVYKTVVQNDGEGVIMKKKNSPYQYDTRKDWIKIKKTDTEDCIVVGITYGTGKRSNTFGALVLAQYDNGKLRIVGKTSGFDDETLMQLYKAIMRMPSHAYPNLEMGNVKKWVPPRIVVEVRYTEKTPYGILRHPVFMRVRDDKAPLQCNIEKVKK